ncbi:M-phase inducer phosphatase [Episyrphus balteatus]|uniref:M-phase inducer phosphatase n=1 Tax=Episyrphus balteatus TaxID=286459 RepID=UPI0024864FB4|nr:M-phase inducer phosphatase [Episyrphus balteatus]XP_055853367.1 M-phase inducer phosphatase [Episyrphus balteatus]
MSAAAVTSPLIHDNNNSNIVRHQKRIAEQSADYIRDLNDEAVSDDNDDDDETCANDCVKNNPLMKRFKGSSVQRNPGDSQSHMLIRRKKLFNLSNEKYGGAVLSPVTEISLNLSDTCLGTPVRPLNRANISGRRKINDEDTAKPSSSDEEKEEVQQQQNHSPEDQVNKSSKCDNSKIGCETKKSKNGVVSNNFDLNAFQRNRGGRRLVMDSSTIHTASGMDELTFYDDESQHPSHAFTSSSPTANALLMDEDRLLSPEGSPQRFQIIQSTLLDKHNNSQQLLQQNRRKILEPSPRLNKQTSSGVVGAMTPAKSFRIFHSLSSGSMESTMDDEYMELFEMESLHDDCEGNAPSNLNSLISGHIKTTKTSPELMKRPPVRRCLSLTENISSANRARTALFEPKTPEILRTVQDRISFLTSNNQSPSLNTTPYSSRMVAERCFKRPDPPSTTVSPVQSKRYKGDFFSASAEKENTGHGLLQIPAQIEQQSLQQPQQATNRPVLRKYVSMNDADIMSALSRSSSEPDLIGDFSKPFCLPLMDGRHRDLKSISSHTMANLITGVYKDSVASYKIIDCRYPYEFEGGHIRGAKNLYTQEQIMEEFVNSKTDTPAVEADGPKRHILVFHCEFSSERGPKLSRFLRNNDRERNTNSYPALHYPEIYLLHGGYKEFFENHSELCDPVAYRPMLEPSYAEAYRHFRAKSKSWNGDVKGLGGTTSRLKKSRSRLLL